MTVVLIIGSGPNAIESQLWARAYFDEILAINNAWRIRPDWSQLIHPEDFPPERQPDTITQKQKIIEARDYVPAMNAFGGVVYQGGTMAFTAGYWALYHFRPKVLAFIGCDMDYSQPQTHFYGTGTADPLRDDITLQSLEAKSARLMLMAARQGCAALNLSTQNSRLVLERASYWEVRERNVTLRSHTRIEAAFAREAALGYAAPDGRYWERAGEFDADELRALDTLWLDAAQDCMIR